MTEFAEHPMDNYPVRPLEFNFEDIQNKNPLWSRTCPEFSMFVNALGVHVPYFERYLIRALSKAKPHVKDEKLLRDMSAIIGQEAHHAKNFIEYNKFMAHKYPKVAKHDAHAREWFSNKAKTDTLKRLVGFTAGYENFTFLAGMIVLDNYERWFKDADPVMKALWVWHQVEEVEHGATAFEVYQYLFGKHEWYRKWMVLVTLLHIAMETNKCYMHMMTKEGWWKNPFKGLSKFAYCQVMLLRFVTNALPVFKKGYHPRNHPMANDSQNKIQYGWRRFEHEGGDVLALDHDKMAKIMALDYKPA